MKRIICLTICALICLCSFVSCGEKEYDIDKGALAAALVAGGCFQDTLSEVPDSLLKYTYQVDEGVSAVLYRGTNVTAEEITVFEAADSTAATAVLDVAKGYISTLAQTYDKYNAAEAARLRDAIIVQKGRYVIVCVCNDKAAAEKIINEHCK